MTCYNLKISEMTPKMACYSMITPCTLFCTYTVCKVSKKCAFSIHFKSFSGSSQGACMLVLLEQRCSQVSQIFCNSKSNLKPLVTSPSQVCYGCKACSSAALEQRITKSKHVLYYHQSLIYSINID